MTVDAPEYPDPNELRLFDDARLALKSVVEMPDQDASRLIRLLLESNWHVNSKLRGEYPELFEPGGRLYDLSSRLVVAIRSVFEA